MIGLILFIVWVVSVTGAVSYYARETMAPTIPRVIIAFSPYSKYFILFKKRVV